MSVSFRANPKGGCVLTPTPDCGACRFTCGKDEVRTVFLSNRITEGIFVLRLDFDLPDRIGSFLRVGVASSEYFSGLDNKALGNSPGSCCLCITQERGMEGGYGMAAKVCGVVDAPSRIRHFSRIIDVEINMEQHTLSFFAQALRIPFVITGIVDSLCLGISGTKDSSFVVCGLRRVDIPLKGLSRLKCSFCQCIL